jgi:MobA/MobL family
MAIYHLSAQVISRGYGHSAVHAAAYRARADLTDERTGLRHDYSRKAGELLFEGIYAPKDAPEWAHDRAQLWNHVEAFEKHRRAELAREFNIALPCELTLEQNRYVLQDWIRDNFMRKGLIADAVIHAPSEQGDERNMHAHVMVVMRKLDGSEFVHTKERFDTYSEKEAAKIAELEALRESWARIGNRHLERHGFEPTLDHRTLEAQGIEREATIHMGQSATAIERDGNLSELGGVNREISAENEQKVIDLAAELAMREARAAARGQVDDIRSRDFPAAQTAPEAVQTREASAASSVPGRENTHTTEPQRAAEETFFREARPAAEAPRVIHLGPPADELGHAVQPDYAAAKGRIDDIRPDIGAAADIAGGLADGVEKALGAAFDYAADFIAPPPPPTKDQVGVSSGYVQKVVTSCAAPSSRKVNFSGRRVSVPYLIGNTLVCSGRRRDHFWTR